MAKSKTHTTRNDQLSKFKQAVEELGGDNNPDRFDEVMRDLTKKPPAPREKSKKDKT
jgi:hypothetical protein